MSTSYIDWILGAAVITVAAVAGISISALSYYSPIPLLILPRGRERGDRGVIDRNTAKLVESLLEGGGSKCL